MTEQIGSLIYLANGQEIRAEVKRKFDEWTVAIDGRTFTVERLAAPYAFLGYGELLLIQLQNGKTFGVVLQPDEYRHHVARLYLVESIDATICLLDKEPEAWRDMTDAEYERER